MKPTALVAQSAHGLGEPVSHPPADAARWPSDTPGGRFYAEWDSQAPVSREGQLMFLFQFLQAGDRWREFLRDCPLHCSGNRGSGSLNVMGAALLSILCGHWRYAHINAVRGDHVNAGLLGMARIVSEDIVRESPATAPVGENKRRRRDPFELRDNQGRGVGGHSAAPWSGRIAVLVTSLDERSYPTLCMPRQYRDRAAAEDNDDELKNQWGWCGLPRAASRRSPLRGSLRLAVSLAHHAKTRPMPHHGRPHRPVLQLVEPLHPASTTKRTTAKPFAPENLSCAGRGAGAFGQWSGLPLLKEALLMRAHAS